MSASDPKRTSVLINIRGQLRAISHELQEALTLEPILRRLFVRRVFPDGNTFPSWNTHLCLVLRRTNVWTSEAEHLPMERFIHLENVRHLREVLKQATDDAKRRQILKLLAVEESAITKADPQQKQS